MSDEGRKMTLLDLFDGDTVVEIPIIQRDYAQGRESAREIREGFLKAMCRALDDLRPLNLDFVYGSVSGGSPRKFHPLDGQQRLTTLFLLHWYLAWKDARTDEFWAAAVREGKSRFTYAVRPSSAEFFDFLVSYVPSEAPSGGGKLSCIISDDSKFFRSWKLDPTILSALEMLDSIHAEFAGKSGLYERLVCKQQPCLTFQWLNLDGFKLSDELYIKMNARGVPLTPFEAFKAKLEQKLDSLALPERRLREKPVSGRFYISERMDTAWTDIFWNEQQPSPPDDSLMLMLRAFVITTRKPDDETSGALTAFLEKKEQFTFSKCEQHGCIDRAFVETMTAVLDCWSKPGECGVRTLLPEPLYYDESKAFAAIAATPTYADFVQFHAYCAYIKRHRANLEPDAFWEWMRVIRNLAENSDYGDLAAFQRSIRSVNELLPASENIRTTLAAPDAKVPGFNQQQVREERLKTQLFAKAGEEWRRRILVAEQHGYFAGQIEFLFSFSGVLGKWLSAGEICTWDAAADAAFQREFDGYFAKAAAVFHAGGLNDFREYRWERALLSIGDYLLPKNSNYSFLKNKDRDVSWKRLLQGDSDPKHGVEIRRQMLKTLLDKIDLAVGIRESLELVIRDSNPVEEWQRALIGEWRAIRYCENRMIRFEDDGGIYLLTGFRRSGKHAELFSYGFFLNPLHSVKVNYHAVSTNSMQPYAVLKCPFGNAVVELRLVTKGEEFELSLNHTEENQHEPIVRKLIEQAGFEKNADGKLVRRISRNTESVTGAVGTILGALNPTG